MRTDTARPVLLKNYSKPDYAIRQVDLDFALHPEKTRVVAKSRVERQRWAKAGTKLRLDGDGLNFVSASLDGKPLPASAYTVSSDQFVLHEPPAKFELEIVTEVNPSANTALSGLYLSGGNYCTQCEAEGFRRITYFLDRPDVLAIFTVRMEAPLESAPVLLSNGNPVAAGKAENGNHYAIWHDPHPKPSYLFALVAGNLASIHQDYVTADNRKVRLGIYVQKGKENRAGYAMDALVRSMRWDEEVFGCNYDLDVFNIVAVPDFNMGAMENKGLNIFNDKYVLADPATATDTDFARIEAIIAHEYFHNWTGDRITCRDWFQLCLKEGLTVYRDQEFSADMRSRPVKRIEDVVTLRAQQFPEDAGPLAHPVRPEAYREINNFYTATVYEKGAEIVRMLALLLGEKKFAKGMARYLKKHDGDAATIEDFIACFEQAAKIDLSQFFLWYRQAGTPHLHLASHYDKEKQTFTVEAEQSLAPTPGQNRKKPMHIPVRAALIGSKSGKQLEPSKITGIDSNGELLEFRQRRHKVVFHSIAERPLLSFNRDFSAPVITDYRYSDNELVFLAANDTDPFNRWQSLRTLASREIIRAMRQMAKRRKPAWNDGLAPAFSSVAHDETLEPAFRAVALTLPSEADIAQLIGKNIDPDAIHSARNALQGHIGEALEPVRAEIAATLDIDGEYAPDAMQSGKRRLRHVLLSHALAANSEAAEKEVTDLFQSATNMTDRQAAFDMILRQVDDTETSEKAIAQFRQWYGDDPLVMDKWFMSQAVVPGRSALATVKRLTRDDAFSWKNPNRMRSVIAAFAQANPTGFNRRDGAGYRYIADAVRKLDAINPQVAARLLTAFRSYKQLELERRKQAEAALKGLKEGGKLSRDVSDILDRTLS